MIHLNLDHLNFYNHDWRVRDASKRDGVFGAISVFSEATDYRYYKSEDGTSWIVFHQGESDSPKHAIKLVFHDAEDGYYVRYFRDDQEMYQFFDKFKFADLSITQDLTSW